MPSVLTAPRKKNATIRRVFSISVLVLVLAACSPFQVRSPHQDSLPASSEGPIAASVLALQLEPQQSSYRLTYSNDEALALRLHSATLATRSLDLQYYMWLNDDSGRLLASELLRAADRGVRVRVLIDDANTRKLDQELGALDAHPNLEVRIYNPYRTRGSVIGNIFEFVFSGMRPNHRMHNKAWIVDGQIAIVGGRNIGDEYFGLHEGFNFRDLGVVLSGRAVQDASGAFDEYWNSNIVIALAAIPKKPGGPTLDFAQQALERDRELLLATPELTKILANRTKTTEINRVEAGFIGTAVRVLSDPPDKWQRVHANGLLGVAADLSRAIDGAQHEVILVSPYFIPGAKGLRWLGQLKARGVRVRVLTNSLNATDVAAVHGGYARYRHRLLRAGIEIHELKNSARVRFESAFRGSSRASLHTKAVVVDGHLAFIGSFNLDPRSTWLNTEMGALIDDRKFAAQVRDNFERSLAPEFSYALSLEGFRLVWTDTHNGQLRLQYREPTSSWSRRIVAFLARVLPVEKHL